MRKFKNSFSVVLAFIALFVAHPAFAKSDVHEVVEKIARECALVVIDIHFHPEKYSSKENQDLAFDVATRAATVFQKMKLSLREKSDREAAQQRLDECKDAFAKEVARLH
jgi:ArsR family metal-binding transcriptional regulator